MSFREKSAWISLISILLVAGFYFSHVPWTLNPPGDGQLAQGLLYAVIAFVVIEVVAHTVVAIRSPHEARTPKDEREHLIELKAIRVAAYVYVVASFAAISTLHLGANRLALGYGVLLSFVIAEVVNYAARIRYYRGGF